MIASSFSAIHLHLPRFNTLAMRLLRSTRFSMTFFNPIEMQGQHSMKTRASVQLGDEDDVVKVHSVADTFSPPPHRRSFMERVRAEPNQILWRTFVTDGDGSWIYESLLSNNLVMMSDGAYEPLY